MMTYPSPFKTAFAAAFFAGAGMAAAAPAVAQSAADFYKSTKVNLLIATAAGSGYDFEGRLVGRHIGKHLPGAPTIVPQNMPGAGGIRVANAIYNSLPQDGSNIALVMNSAAMFQVIGGQGVQYDVTKMQWIGSLSPAVDSMGVWHTQNVKTIEDAKKKEIVAAATGKGANSSYIPAAMNELLGTKFKIITGYKGSPDMNTAMEQGEVGARGTSWASWVTTRMDWIRDGKFIMIMYAGPRPKDMPQGVPSMADLVTNPDDKQVMNIVFSGAEFGRPFAMGPTVPKDRVAAMRKAFVDMTKDPEFISEAEKLKVDLAPVAGEHMQEMAKALVATPPHLAERAKALVE
jgi:tripartite-type tricarboxylate transporter receptor subunit TctC